LSFVFFFSTTREMSLSSSMEKMAGKSSFFHLIINNKEK